MSEFLSEDEPDPLSGRLNFLDPDSRVSSASNVAYDRRLSDEFATLEIESRQQYEAEQAAHHERQAVVRLSSQADLILKNAHGCEKLVEESYRVSHEGSSLRRRQHSSVNSEGKTRQAILYFFQDERGPDYCRSWQVDGAQINYCYTLEGHEPAADVMERLEDRFRAFDSQFVSQSRGKKLRKVLGRFGLGGDSQSILST